MVARRLLFLAGIVLLTFLLVASLAPRRTSDSDDPPTATAPVRPPPDGAGARRVTATVDGAAQRPAVVRARVGDLLALRVSAPAPDEVELVGLRRFDAADSFAPARFEFFVRRPGTYPIRLREARRVVGRLVFAPR